MNSKKSEFNSYFKTIWESWENYPKLTWGVSIVGLFLLSAIAFLSHLGDISLIDKTEPMFVEAARQMHLTGDWITPYWNGETRFDKPPLIYWLIVIAFQTVGVNEWGARLPSAIAAILSTFLVFYTLRYFGGLISLETESARTCSPFNSTRLRGDIGGGAWWGMAMMTLNPAWIAWGRAGVSDMLLASCMTISLLAFFLAYAQPKTRQQKGWYFIFYSFAALAVLAKGPIGIVLPILIIGGFLIYTKQWQKVIWEMQLIKGSLVFLIIAVPWFVLVTMANGQAYLDTFFGHHNFERFTSVVSNHPGPWFYYFPVILVALLPWSVYLPIAIYQVKFWQIQDWRSQDRSQHLGLFALFWLVIIFVFFSLSATKLPSYILPSIPAGVILISLWGNQQNNIESEHPKISLPFLITGFVNILVLLILAIASFISPKLVGDDTPNFSQLLESSHLTTVSGIIWLIASGITLYCLIKPQWRRAVWAGNALGFFAFMALVALPVGQLLDTQRHLPLRQLSTTVRQVHQPNEPLLVIGVFRPSLVYYTQQNIEFMTYNIQQRLLKLFPVNTPVDTILIITRPKDIAKLGLQYSDYQLLQDQGDYQLIRIKVKVLLKR
ncbi:glycosyltransferase family 39 protein [Planktothrix agardhii 1029]|uniref:ArnT family glycosyltransferase n=1 Tax=Planktothrix agardhii TaxID=1160 RepID=UPI001D0AE324|nr:glycosyltransferase family 39 protein [Planktothrix agardhii]MCB8766077.1 glycosyltransferase family 39 protein [Planktothrix agardhii 1809]MCB8784128.1 glycosyltransferase family 39 protein [Planktothrix agardhii 1808]MCF3564851.1 glycosyltransferase family 39 protein [Planktothrix agardhii 1807]MCF3588211.1 glycosyltransferase family 39 protein [Planktothrix agardhii 1029]MCF3622513.1 glycosyltransferase family 39 protein [Planktothrix agardhii 1030]